jgi:hypothetical protein
MAVRLAAVILALLLLSSGPAAWASPEDPAWKDLGEAERQVLAPLKDEWPKFDPVHKRKWVSIAKEQPTLSLYQQWQLKNRIREWAKLSPDQREAARARYKDFEQVPPERQEKVRQQYEIKKMADPPETAPVTNR